MKKMISSVTSIDECIKALPDETKDILETIRKLGKKLVPESTETVKYGMPTLQLKGKSFFHFCGYKHHIGIYPASGSFEMAELEKYRTGKGTYQFPLDKPIPYDLIEKMMVYRSKQALATY